MKTHSRSLITELAPNEVMVFGSNTSGFHGAGSAGYAFKGTAANDWRSNVACLRAINAKPGDASRIGKWAVWGTARGLMTGHEGKSYAIVTTDQPGRQGAVTIETVAKEVATLAQFAKDHPELTFYCAAFGLSRQWGGFSWFTLDQMRSIFAKLDAAGDLPENLLPPFKFHP